MPRRLCGLIPYAAVAAAYGSIAAAAYVSRAWWSPLLNALSDLGRPSNGVVAAAVFDSGLYLAGLLMAAGSMFCCHGPARSLGTLVGLLLGLVGVLNESFGHVHYLVSVALFLAMLAYIATVGPRVIGAAGAALLSLTFIAVWALHYAMRVPRGVAVPETVTSLIFAAVYLSYTTRRCRG